MLQLIDRGDSVEQVKALEQHCIATTARDL